jgi:hypothetical protein
MLPTYPPTHGLGPWLAATVAGLAIALTGLAGCGGSDDASSKTTPNRPPTVQRTADPRVVSRIPLHSTINQVVARLGRPARIEHRRVPFRESKKSKPRVQAQTCYIYGVKGGRPADGITMCFIGGKLASVLTVAPKK